MKKRIMALLLVFCLAVVFVGCNKLPNPEDVLQQTLNEIKSGGGAFSEILQAEQAKDQVLPEHPELMEQFKEVIKTKYAQVDYTVVDSLVDEEEQTAIINVDVTSLSEEAYEMALNEWLIRYIEEHIKNNDVDYATMYADQYAKIKEIYNDSSLARETRRVSVTMVYNAETKEWVISNPEVLLV